MCLVFQDPSKIGVTIEISTEFRRILDKFSYMVTLVWKTFNAEKISYLKIILLYFVNYFKDTCKMALIIGIYT